TARWCSHSRLASHLRIASAVVLTSAGAAMAFVAAKSSSPSVAAKSSSPSLVAKLGGKRAAELEAQFVRNKAFADHFKTLLGRAKSSGEGSRLDGPEQEAYDSRAYPSKWIGSAEQRAARAAANAIRKTGKPTSSLLTSPSSSPLISLASYPAT